MFYIEEVNFVVNIVLIIKTKPVFLAALPDSTQHDNFNVK